MSYTRIQSPKILAETYQNEWRLVCEARRDWTDLQATFSGDEVYRGAADMGTTFESENQIK